MAKSVAVLPFANMSADPDNEYFTDGMAEEIINALSKIQALRVASRTSSFAFKGKNEDIGEIGKKLKVSTVLEGSVRKMGNKLRITAQLVNVADGYHLWSERYDREMEDVFEIQDDISQAIVKALRVILSEDEKKQIEKAARGEYRGLRFLPARQAVLPASAVRASTRRGRCSRRRSRSTRATPAPMPGVADCYSLLYSFFDAREFEPARGRYRQQPGARTRARPGGSACGPRHGGLRCSKRFEEAEQEFEQAMRAGSASCSSRAIWFARPKQSQGRFQEALNLFERAVVAAARGLRDSWLHRRRR